MSRYIDADKAIEEAKERGFDFFITENNIEGCILFLRKQPTADVEPVRHGHWIPIHKRTYARNGIVGEICTVGYTCSECGHEEDYEAPYCNCGAKMDEEAEDDNIM